MAVYDWISEDKNANNTAKSACISQLTFRLEVSE